jgi:hypothetical protein
MYVSKSSTATVAIVDQYRNSSGFSLKNAKFWLRLPRQSRERQTLLQSRLQAAPCECDLVQVSLLSRFYSASVSRRDFKLNESRFSHFI